MFPHGNVVYLLSVGLMEWQESLNETDVYNWKCLFFVFYILDYFGFEFFDEIKHETSSTDKIADEKYMKEMLLSIFSTQNDPHDDV